MTGVMIGVDPHKGSHTAVALDPAEVVLGKLRVRASMGQLEQLLGWAQAWPERRWAIEGAGGLGHLLAQQLLGAGELVLDVQPKLAARVRLLNTGAVNKNDPNDARSVAVAALRAPDVRAAVMDYDTAVMKVWARRHHDLSRTRSRIVCRLHAVLCDLVPGGFAREISAAQAAAVLQEITSHDSVAAARMELAHDLLEDLRRVDEQRRQVRKRLATIIAASRTSLTDIYGVGPLVAATVLGAVGDITRFPSRDHFAAYNGTAPIEVSSGNRVIHRLSRRGNRRLNYVIHMAALTQIGHQNNPGRAYYEKKTGEGMAGKSALRAVKRKISDALYAAMLADAAPRMTSSEKGPGGQAGNDSESSATGSHPEPALRKSHSRTTTNTTTTRTYKPSPTPPKGRRRAS